MGDALVQGRSAFAASAWAGAYEWLSAADRRAPLEPDDLERLATAAYLVGRDDQSAELWARAHHELLGRGEPGRAARCAFWLAFGLLNRGESARGGGWVARARRVLADLPEDRAEHGYLRWLAAFQSILDGETAAALAGFEAAAAAGDRWREPDLVALARTGAGRALIRLGETGPGTALLDEVMVAVETGELSPMVVGDVYCSVLEGCQELFDLRRAQQWTAVLTSWCATQPELVPYRGQCLLHRAELLQLHGAWPDAMEEDGLLEGMRELFATCPIPGGELGLLHLGGALNERPAADGAVGNRDARFVLGVKGMWAPGDPDAGRYTRWVRDAWARLRPWSTGATYVNFQTAEEGDDRVRASYGANYERLVEVKRRYDPENLFRTNRNIRP